MKMNIRLGSGSIPEVVGVHFGLYRLFVDFHPRAYVSIAHAHLGQALYCFVFTAGWLAIAWPGGGAA